ncbi:FtsX-like permease family protein [Streptomyces sp. ACA25]|uniref:ABC transporter permease n=1 Tax=Streptomyces sp. ACA25 TaxID=3022596 RepID=UPI0023071446|nr:ABC transporter permease [Streptomyces sp. ACA25]MDB1086379.1 FtsX-like permease family protein [Streptomyces sp. ACA25]
MRASVRWALADLRAHRGESLVIVLATAGIITSLLLAGALFSYAANPWQRTFTQSEGAHVWIHTAAGTEAERLAGLDGVTAASGPFRTTRATAELRGTRAAIELRSAGAEPPATARPLMTSGSWLTATAGPAGEAPGGIVLESSLAAALWAGPGDTVTVQGSNGEPRALRVAGIADTAEPRYRRGDTPGTAWVLPPALDRVEPHSEQQGQVIGLRLDAPQDTGYAVQRAVTLLGSDQVTGVSDWQQARAEAGADGRLLGLLLGLFGLGALLAAALALAGAISTRIRGHLRDISVLKAIGFTPGQVVRMFLVQHLAFALLGVAAGAVVTATLGPRLPGRIGEALRLWRELPEHAWAPFAVTAGSVLFIATATGLAAWRAGRVPPVPVARAALPSRRPMSRPARRALGLRLPPALVLGWRAAFQRPGHAAASVGRLAVPFLLITVALSTWATLDRFAHRPAEVGLPAGLSVRAEELGEEELRELLAEHPEVIAAHPGTETAALVPGQTGTLTLRGLGTREEPYPFTVAEGRAATGPDEAVAGQGLLDLLDARVGDWVRMTVEGRPQILHIVGRSIEPEAGGRVISATVDTLREQDPDLQPDYYQLVLHPEADRTAVADALESSAGGLLDVREVPNPADGLSSVRGVIVGLIGVLVLIGLAGLATTTGSTVRDRRRDLLALKAIGLTPRQIMAVIVTGAGFVVLAAAVVGTTLGRVFSSWLIDLQGRTSGIGAGIAQPASPGVLALMSLLAVALAVAFSVVPAARAARRRLADTLSETL